MIRDCFEHAFAKQWIPRSSTYVQAWTLFLSLRVSCPNEAFSMVSFFLFRGKSWAQVFPQLGRRREKPRRPSFTNLGYAHARSLLHLPRHVIGSVRRINPCSFRGNPCGEIRQHPQVTCHRICIKRMPSLRFPWQRVQGPHLSRCSTRVDSRRHIRFAPAMPRRIGIS